MPSSINCHVYRCTTKQGMYVYLAEKDHFEAIPTDLRERLGKLEYSFEFTLSENRKLVRYDAKQVIQRMKDDGYFLQMPPPESIFLDLNFKHSDGF